MGTDPQVRSFSYHRPRARGPQRPSAPAPSRSADLVGEVLGRLGGSGRALEFRVFDCYMRVVGETCARAACPSDWWNDAVRPRRDVAARPRADAARAEILERMATEMGQGIVLELRTRVGRIPTSASLARIGRRRPRAACPHPDPLPTPRKREREIGPGAYPP